MKWPSAWHWVSQSALVPSTCSRAVKRPSMPSTCRGALYLPWYPQLNSVPTICVRHHQPAIGTLIPPLYPQPALLPTACHGTSNGRGTLSLPWNSQVEKWHWKQPKIFFSHHFQFMYIALKALLWVRGTVCTTTNQRLDVIDLLNGTCYARFFNFTGAFSNPLQDLP